MYEDIIKALSKYYNDDVLALDTLNDFLELYLHKPKQVTEDLKDEMNEYAISRNLCPLCLNELETKKEVINQTEAWGKLVNEYQYRKICRSCNWQEED